MVHGIELGALRRGTRPDASLRAQSLGPSLAGRGRYRRRHNHSVSKFRSATASSSSRDITHPSGT